MGLVDGLLERCQDRWFARAEARASKDPEWATIESRRHDPNRPDTSIMLDGDRNLTEVEWNRQEEIFRDLNGECPVTPWREFIRTYGLVAQRRRLRRFAQRGTRGWADEDTWNLDSYLARVIAASVQHLREHGHAHPAALSEEEWDDVLTRIAAGFGAIANSDFHDPRVDSAAKGVGDEALGLLHRWFPNLWD